MLRNNLPFLYEGPTTFHPFRSFLALLLQSLLVLLLVIARCFHRLLLPRMLPTHQLLPSSLPMLQYLPSLPLFFFWCLHCLLCCLCCRRVSCCPPFGFICFNLLCRFFRTRVCSLTCFTFCVGLLFGFFFHLLLDVQIFLLFLIFICLTLLFRRWRLGLSGFALCYLFGDLQLCHDTSVVTSHVKNVGRLGVSAPRLVLLVHQDIVQLFLDVFGLR